MAEKRENRINGVIQQYGSRLRGFISNRVSNSLDAEDILQEVWYQFSKVVDLDSIEQVSGWLFQVARNKVTDNYRRKNTYTLEDEEYDENGGSNHTQLLASFPAPEDEDLKEIFWEELMEALDELPDKQREIFILNELEEMTFQEIADQSGENIKTLISRKGYAVKHLRKRLERLYEEYLS